MDQGSERKPGPGAGLIVRKPVSRQSPVHEAQARFLATLTRELIVEYRMETELAGRGLEFREFFELPAYLRFLDGACACGFVCRDFKPDFPIADMLIRPRRSVGALRFHDLRRYVHTLFRAEAWAGPYSSPIREALIAGTLEILCERLLMDESLYHDHG